MNRERSGTCSRWLNVQAVVHHTCMRAEKSVHCVVVHTCGVLTQKQSADQHQKCKLGSAAGFFISCNLLFHRFHMTEECHIYSVSQN